MVDAALFFLALAPIAAIIYIVWAYRRRTAAHAADRSERLARILDAPAPRAASPAGEVAQAAPPAAKAGAAATRTPPLYATRDRLLTAEHIKLHELLRAGLPGHEVLAHVSLSTMIEVAGLPEGREREQRLRGLSQHSIDCVVCTRSFEVVAAIDLESGQGAETRFKAECLKAAGVRYLQWNAAGLPASSEVSDLVQEG